MMFLRELTPLKTAALGALGSGLISALLKAIFGPG